MSPLCFLSFLSWSSPTRSCRRPHLPELHPATVPWAALSVSMFDVDSTRRVVVVFTSQVPLPVTRNQTTHDNLITLTFSFSLLSSGTFHDFNTTTSVSPRTSHLSMPHPISPQLPPPQLWLWSRRQFLQPLSLSLSIYLPSRLCPHQLQYQSFA